MSNFGSNNTMGYLFGDKDKSEQFPDPFILPSNAFVPRSLDTALDFGLLLYFLNARYRRTSTRVVSHFITELRLTSKRGNENSPNISTDEKEEHKDLLLTQLKLFDCMLQMGQEWAAYGNSFWRMHFPFNRFIVDTRGGSLRTYSVDMFGAHAEYDYKSMTYSVPDPSGVGPFHERQKVQLPFKDLPDTTTSGRSKVKLISMDPRQMFILESHISGRTQYVFRFEEWFRKEIQEGKLHQVNETPRDMLEAIANDQDFLFDEGEVFHFKSPTIAGMRARGWGIPETLLTYRELHQLQVYRKIDEQVGMDFMLPFRVFSPALSNGAVDDSLINSHLGVWNNRVGEMIKSRRQDPTKMHSFPFPLQMQEFGATGKELVPKDLIQYQEESLHDAMGYPIELFKGSLQVQQVPTAIRLFENSFMFIPRGYNTFAQWGSNKIRRYLGQDHVEVSLVPNHIAQDLENRHIYLQLMSGGEMSRRTALGGFGVDDPINEIEERLDEDMRVQEAQTKAQEDLQRKMESGSLSQQMEQQLMAEQEQAGAAPAGGGAPPTPGGGPPPMPSGEVSPTEIQSLAEQHTAYALSIPTDGERRKYLQDMEATNENLYALVKTKMEKQRNQWASEGKQMGAEQAQGG